MIPVWIYVFFGISMILCVAWVTMTAVRNARERKNAEREIYRNEPPEGGE